MRLFVSLIATAVLFAASAASAAVTFNVDVSSSGDLANLNAGDTITLDITMRSDAPTSGENVFAIGGAVFGYGGALRLGAGTTSTAAMTQFQTGPGAGFGGLDSTQPVEEVSADEVQWFNGVSINGTPADGSLDISPLPGNAVGGPHAQVIMIVTGDVTGPISFGVGADAAYGDAVVGDGGSFLTANNATIDINVIPEPGTALLMGLGLAGLAAAGRRS